MDLDSLGLRGRPKRLIAEAGIRSVVELLQRLDELPKIKGFGGGSFREVKAKLERAGFVLTVDEMGGRVTKEVRAEINRLVAKVLRIEAERLENLAESLDPRT